MKKEKGKKERKKKAEKRVTISQERKAAASEKEEGNEPPSRSQRNISFAVCVIAKNPELGNLPKDRNEIREYLRRRRSVSV